MPTYNPPKKNTAYVFYISLISQSTSNLQANPTLATGDVKVAIDDGAPANLATLPAVDADFTKRVKVALTADEMNGDNITIIFSDAAGDEWYDLVYNIPTVANQLDDLATDIANIDGATAAEVWAYATRTLTQSAASVTATVTGSDISVKRGDSWSISLTGLGSVTGYTSIWFTAKGSHNDPDTSAIVQIKTGVGLVYINGAAGTAGNGAITVDDAGDGDITITLQEAETAGLDIIRSAHYDVQVLNGGDVTTLTEGTFVITGDVTRAVS